MSHPDQDAYYRLSHMQPKLLQNLNPSLSPETANASVNLISKMMSLIQRSQIAPKQKTRAFKRYLPSSETFGDEIQTKPWYNPVSNHISTLYVYDSLHYDWERVLPVSNHSWNISVSSATHFNSSLNHFKRQFFKSSESKDVEIDHVVYDGQSLKVTFKNAVGTLKSMFLKTVKHIIYALNLLFKSLNIKFQVRKILLIV
jgi:hypothetical protein